MKATELRIGNLVKWNYEESSDGNAYPVEYGYELDDIKNNPNIVKPIPLTEEWLERFGFEKTTSGISAFLKTESVTFWWGGHFVNMSDNETQYNLVNVSYVHQLQNLYFALTGEELTGKELV